MLISAPVNRWSEWVTQLPESERKNLYWGVFCGLGVVLMYLWKKLHPPTGTQFARREYESEPKQKRDSRLSEARLERKKAEAHHRPTPSTLALQGITLEGPPHRILGVPEDATPQQIQAAYRSLVQRYHPDKVGQTEGGGTEAAQKSAAQIVEILTRSRDALLGKKNP